MIIMGRFPCCEENGIKKGPWSPGEDQKLVEYINKHGHGSWRILPKLAGLNRCGKSCRLRWTNYLRPGIKRGNFTKEEEQTIMHLHSVIGNKWSTIASHLPGRTDNEVKNVWNTRIRKKLIQMGIDPMTHQPRTDIFASLNNLVTLTNLHALIGKLPFQQEAMKLQRETLQLANNKQLNEYLLQTNISDIEALNFLDSFPQNVPTQGIQNQDLTNPVENANLHILLNNPILLDSQAPLNIQTPLDDDQTNPILYPSSCFFPLHMSESATSLSNNVGDGGTTSSSSHGGGGVMPINWSNLFFEEPFLHDSNIV